MTTPITTRPGPAGSPAQPGDAVLRVEDLSVSAGRVPLLQDVSFTVGRGERLGLIGESGSGKSLTALAVMGLLGEELQARGRVRLAGHDGDLLRAGERSLARLRGRDLAMVFQEPMTALNPTMRVGRQVAEVLRIHGTARGRAAQARAVALLDQVGLPDPAAAARAYPHQLSGGQRQRVVTAIALANDPDLLICDEPTTALDVTVQARVLDLIVRGVTDRGAAMLFITHDLAVVASVCERVLVMYGGRVVEAGPVQEVFRSPRHRYTEGLLAASDLDRYDEVQDDDNDDAAHAGGSGTGRGRRPLPTIPGSVPPAGRFPDGCVFRTRCRYADRACEELPPWVWTDQPAHGHACVHPVGDPDLVPRVPGRDDVDREDSP